jgi:hypothetical protein
VLLGEDRRRQPLIKHGLCLTEGRYRCGASSDQFAGRSATNPVLGALRSAGIELMSPGQEGRG